MRLMIVTALLSLLIWSPASAGNGSFDYFLLSLSWSPQFCAEHGSQPFARRQCAAGDRGFVLHGLWPEDNDGGHPASCRPAGRVPSRLVDRMLPMMPSEGLIQHEWVTHGTCSGQSMDDYFDSLAQAFRKLRIPAPLRQPAPPLTTSVRRLKEMFANANPGLAGSMMTVRCGRGNAVEEVWICLDKSLNFRDCGGDQFDRCSGGRARFRSAR